MGLCPSPVPRGHPTVHLPALSGLHSSWCCSPGSVCAGCSPGGGSSGDSRDGGRPCSHIQASRALDAASVVRQPHWGCLARGANRRAANQLSSCGDSIMDQGPCPCVTAQRVSQAARRCSQPAAPHPASASPAAGCQALVPSQPRRAPASTAPLRIVRHRGGRKS